MNASPFNLKKLLRDVFDPSPDDRVLVMVDVPREGLPDSNDWRERRQMAREWLAAFGELGASCLPLLTYPATGANNANLPEFGTQEGCQIPIAAALAEATLVVAMTEFSATAPLSAFISARPNLRAASMPGVLRRMERTALAADYVEVGRKAGILAERLDRAEGAQVEFDTGHSCYFDLRYRTAHADDGDCRPHKKGFRLINLPSGEAFIVPYEGERLHEPSKTAGEIPVAMEGAVAVLRVQENRIVDVQGDRRAEALRAVFDVDPARRNVAELGLGCNDRAVVAGNVLEDEKAGFHWAFGRSEHLGGTRGPDRFLSPSTVLHQDIVYARASPVSVRRLTLVYPDGQREVLMENGRYSIFPV